MKKLVAIEVDSIVDAKNNRSIYKFTRDFDGEVKLITNASQHISEITEALQDCTDFAFQSVFTGPSEYMVEPLIEILSKIKHSINIHISGYNTEQNIIRILNYSDSNAISQEYHFPSDKVSYTDQMLHSIKHHNLLVMNKFDDETIDFSKHVDRYQKRIDIEIAYYNTLKDSKTGVKVRIKDMSTAGIAWGNLHTGDVVDVLDCKLVDPNPDRGVWVWGVDKPVKILNDTQYNEFEFISNDDISLEDRIIKESSLAYIKLTNKDYQFIRGVISDDSLSTRDKAQEICDELEIERRGNRQKIISIINDYETEIA